MLERGAPSTRQTTATGRWEAMAIWAASPAGSAAPLVRLRPPGSRSPCQRPDLALGLPQRPIIARPVGPLPLQAVLTALQEVVAPGGQPMGLDPSSRDSVSSGSPRSNLSAASIFLPADHLGRDR